MRSFQNLRYSFIMFLIQTLKIVQFQVSDLPFPYKGVRHFESSIRHPIGNTWNPESSYRNLIQPKVITQMGTIIQPIDEDLLVKSKSNRGKFDGKSKKKGFKKNKKENNEKNNKNDKKNENKKGKEDKDKKITKAKMKKKEKNSESNNKYEKLKLKTKSSKKVKEKNV